MTFPKVIIYSDGACLGNPGPGGYAAILISQAHQTERVVAGKKTMTTNNQMELMGAIVGLRALKKKCHVTLFSDSTYVVKGMTEWITSWKKTGFRNAKKQSIANQDLWIDLDNAAKVHEVTWRWVKAHAGVEYNERVDEIAREQALLAMHEQKATS